MLLISVTLLLGIANAVPAMAEARFALVIGNGSYKTNRLKNPRSDAGLMARTLASAGFQVMTVMDGSTAEMRRAIADFGTKLQEPGAVALFYYGGHGVQIDGENYLIPLDADIATSGDVEAQAVPLQSILRTMARSATRLNIVVLDACRDNPFQAGEWTATVTGLASVLAPAVTFIAYSTGPGELASDGADNNSPYTAALASEMLQPGATLEDVFRATRRHVLARTGSKQTPWEHSSLLSAFTFVPAVQPESSAAQSSDAAVAEMLAWQKIKETQDAAQLAAHIERYPQGLFAELAAVRLTKLMALRGAAPWSAVATGGIDASARIASATVAYHKALMLDAETAPATDLALAAKLYAEAASEGLPAAIYRVGRGYDKGRGVARDVIEAARWYERSAALGYPAGMAALGTMHEFGEGAAPNLAEALRWYRLAAEAGDPSGMTSLAFLYADGKGVARSFSEARRLYALAAAKDHPRAQFNLGLMTLKGQGQRADPAAAIQLFQAAADAGHAAALIELARLSDRGLYVARDAAKAAQYVIKAARSGERDGRTLDVTSYSWSYATRRAIQKELAAQGLYAGMSHGIFNAATRQALLAVAQP